MSNKKKKPRCPKCGPKGMHYINMDHDYDAYYCAICGEWLEKQCGDEKCDYCKNRPEKADVGGWSIIKGK